MKILFDIEKKFIYQYFNPTNYLLMNKAFFYYHSQVYEALNFTHVHAQELGASEKIQYIFCTQPLCVHAYIPHLVTQFNNLSSPSAIIVLVFTSFSVSQLYPLIDHEIPVYFCWKQGVGICALWTHSFIYFFSFQFFHLLF